MKVILPLHKSVNKIDKQSSTIKQLCWENTATKIRSSKYGKQNQCTQKKKVGKSLASGSDKKHQKGRR
jgi:hypothetical protein